MLIRSSFWESPLLRESPRGPRRRHFQNCSTYSRSSFAPASASGFSASLASSTTWSPAWWRSAPGAPSPRAPWQASGNAGRSAGFPEPASRAWSFQLRRRRRFRIGAVHLRLLPAPPSPACPSDPSDDSVDGLLAGLICIGCSRWFVGERIGTTSTSPGASRRGRGAAQAWVSSALVHREQGSPMRWAAQDSPILM